MKRVGIAIALVFVVLAGVMGWQVLRPSDEPVYKGKKLTEWLSDMWRDGDFAIHPETKEAVRQIGTNGIPTLLALLRAKDSPLKLKLVKLVQRQRVVKVQFTSAEHWNGAAAIAFGMLGTNAQSAMPDLAEIAKQNISPSSHLAAMQALEYVSP